jgi:hypothetical protein
VLKLVSNHGLQPFRTPSGESRQDFEIPHFPNPEHGSLIGQYEATPAYVETVYKTGVDPRPIGRFGVERSISPEEIAWIPESLRLLQIAEEIQESRNQHPLRISELDTTSEISFVRSTFKKLIDLSPRQ